MKDFLTVSSLSAAFAGAAARERLWGSGGGGSVVVGFGVVKSRILVVSCVISFLLCLFLQKGAQQEAEWPLLRYRLEPASLPRGYSQGLAERTQETVPRSIVSDFRISLLRPAL